MNTTSNIMNNTNSTTNNAQNPDLIITREGHPCNRNDPEIQRINNEEENRYQRDGIMPSVVKKYGADLVKMEGKYAQLALQYQDVGDKMKYLSFKMHKKLNQIRFMRGALDARAGRRAEMQQAQADLREIDYVRWVAMGRISELSDSRRKIHYSNTGDGMTYGAQQASHRPAFNIFRDDESPEESPMDVPPSQESSRFGRTPNHTPAESPIRGRSPLPIEEPREEDDLMARLHDLQVFEAKEREAKEREAKGDSTPPPPAPRKTRAQLKREVENVEVPQLFTERDEKGFAQCPICWHNLYKESTTVLNCGHVFHYYCAERAWSGDPQRRCPTCRRRTRFVRRPSASARALGTKFDEIFMPPTSSNSE